VFTTIYGNSPAVPSDGPLLDASMRIRDMGRLLLATEIRSAKTYWHVQQPFTSGVTRVYPSAYQPKVIGMIWSMLAQEQTWFGNEPWKSYGIQLMPLTVAGKHFFCSNMTSTTIPSSV
jgi:endoglucanase Acf2